MPGLLEKLKDAHVVSHLELAFANFLLVPGNPITMHIPAADQPAVLNAVKQFRDEATAKINGTASGAQASTAGDGAAHE